MKRMKWLLTICSVMVILAMNFAPVSALDGPVIEGAEVGVPISESDPTEVKSDEVVVAPLQISPIDRQRVYTKTPKFLFTRHPDATKYRIGIYLSDIDAIPLYTFSSPGSCTTTVCVMISPYKLKTFQYIPIKGGLYYWDVEALINNTWQHKTQREQFYVLSRGFTSTFDLNTRLWSPVEGTWVRTSTGFYKSAGIPDYYASAMQLEYFEKNYVYEVKLKRKYSIYPSFIVINGSPDPLMSNGMWLYGHVLEYSNSGEWRFSRIVGGTVEEMASGTSPYIEPYSWNTWTIWTDHPDIYVWVNGVFLVKVTEMDPNMFVGYVGLGLLRGIEPSPLLVDSATLYHSSIRPMDITLETDSKLE